MDKFKKVLQVIEIACWVVAFLNAIKWSKQILYTLFIANGTVNEQDALVRIYISVLSVIPALVIKGARSACKSD
jgi:hypothetical protein